MSITIEYLAEPKLQFGQYFEHEDSKTGIAEFGPFGKNVAGLHPSEIKVGFVGTRQTISGARGWIEECGSYIESENITSINPAHLDRSEDMFGTELDESTHNIRIEKILNRDFPGFNKDSEFACSFQLNDRWDRVIQPREIDPILSEPDKSDRIYQMVNLIDSQFESIASHSPTPDIIVLALTPEMVDEAHSVHITGNYHLNFRRLIKARAMQWGIPIQILQRRTVIGSGKSLQEKSTRAWNFCTAQYYKADGVPWSPVSLDRGDCFIGLSFYVTEDLGNKLTMRSSIATAFDHLGQGLVLRGDPFEWDGEKLGLTPHMTQNAARKLIIDILNEYVRVSGVPPRRVVIYKTSKFWGPEHSEFNELDGFNEGIDETFSRCDRDLVALGRTGVRLIREGNYPPLRGTYFTIDNSEHFLYTMGFIPYLNTSPTPYVPEPLQIIEHHGGSDPKDLFREVLGLTKMNVNNCSFADGTPIILSFSRKIGEIMKHVPEGGIVHPNYKFYM